MQNTQLAFRALNDPTRREILMDLASSEMTIGQVVAKFQMTRAAIKKHLKILEEGELISVHPNGRERINRIELDGLQPITNWLKFFDQFWGEKLTDLKTTIEDDIKKEAK